MCSCPTLSPCSKVHQNQIISKKHFFCNRGHFSSQYVITDMCFAFVYPQFWDTRSPNPMMSLQMPERCYCADVVSVFWVNMYFLLVIYDKVDIFFKFWLWYVGVPHGSGCHGWERPDRVPAGESTLWVSQNRLSPQTSGKCQFLLQKKYILITLWNHL